MRKRAQIKPPRVTWRMRRAMPYTYTVTYSGAAGKWLVKGDITIPATHVRTSAVLTSTTFRGPNRKEAVRQFKEWVKAEREGAYTQYKSKIKPEREWVW